MKKIFLISVIAYSACLLVLQDWPSMINSTGPASAPFLALMLVDVAFAGFAGFKLIGPAFFEEEGEEISLHAEDVNVPDQWFYGLFAIDLLGHFGWHGYESIHFDGAYSLYASIWVIVEFIAFFLTFVLYRHALQAARRAARPRPNLRQAS